MTAAPSAEPLIAGATPAEWPAASRPRPDTAGEPDVVAYVAALGRSQLAVSGSTSNHLEAILAEAGGLFHAEGVAIRFADPESIDGVLQITAAGLSRPGPDVPRRWAMLSEAELIALRTRTVVVCGGPRGVRFPEFVGREATAVMVAPLTGIRPPQAHDVPRYSPQRVDAVLVVFTTAPGRRFGPLDAQILEVFATTVSSAFSSAHRMNELQRAYEQSTRALEHDALTGLPNRTQFIQRLNDALQRFSNTRGRVGVIFIDLDDFKLVNDRYGHETGDRLLIAFASRMQRILRAGEFGARLSGDEFVVLLEGIEDRIHGLVMVERIRIALSEPFQLGEVTLTAEASFGLAFVDDDRMAVLDAASLLRDADVALYRAKSEGKARSIVFDRSMRDRELGERNLASRLRSAVRSSPTDGSGLLELVYQPLFDLASGEITSVEALLRWHDQAGDIPPDDFIPVAEQTGMMVQLGRWVVEAALHQLVCFRTISPDLSVAINISGRQLMDDSFVPDLSAAMEATRLPASAVTLEFTETYLLERSEPAIARLRELRRRGIRTALDDFGTGYSSLTSLRRFEFNICKVDRAFVEGLDAEGGDPQLCEMLIAVGLHLGLQVVGEGVETAGQLERLRALGCHFGQGYHLGRPLAAEALVELLIAQSRNGV